MPLARRITLDNGRGAHDYLPATWQQICHGGHNVVSLLEVARGVLRSHPVHVKCAARLGATDGSGQRSGAGGDEAKQNMIGLTSKRTPVGSLQGPESRRVSLQSS